MTVQGAAQVTILWRFVRGDLEARAFEKWACESEAFEVLLGADFYLDVISTDYRDDVAVDVVRARLETWLRGRSEHTCECVTIPDEGVVDMGAHEAVFGPLEQVATRGEPNWWLWAARCHRCGQGWLIGSEERQNDIFCMRRLRPEVLADILADQRWPPDFDHYEKLLEIGRRAGRSVRFIEPLTRCSLRATVTDLARDRPGLALSTLRDLLNLDRDVAEQVARSVMEEADVEIDLDG